MAIAFDSETDSSGSNVTSLTYAHTCTGSNLALIVGVGANGATETITGVTYNGVSMTQLNKVQQTSSVAWQYLYGITAPTTGANNVVVSFSAGTDCWSYAVSYTGVSQSGLPDASNTNATASGTSITTNITTVADNSWLVTIARNFAGNVAAGTNFTLRSAAFPIAIGDSNAAITPAGATSTVANSGSNSTWTANVVSLAPVGAVVISSSRRDSLLLMGVS